MIWGFSYNVSNGPVTDASSLRRRRRESEVMGITALHPSYRMDYGAFGFW